MPIPRLVAVVVAAVTILVAPAPSSADTLFFRVTEGRIAEVRSFWDVAAFLKQTTLPPESAAALKRKP